MQHSKGLVFLMFVLVSSLAQAGVVMEMVATDAAGQETGRSKIFAQSKMIRMDHGGSDASASMIFLGDRFVYVDHDDKSYVVMDEAMLNEVSAKISEAMKEMEAQLANMPPEQRAMVEQMMKGKMDGMMPQADTASKPRVESMGKKEWQSYTCRQYAVYEADKKTQQICAAKLDDVAGADEVVEAFIGMAAYIKKMTESMPMMANQGFNPGELMAEIEGFPVHTVDYRNGQVMSEMSLDSVDERKLDPALFSAPDGYRQQDPFGAR